MHYDETQNPQAPFDPLAVFDGMPGAAGAGGLRPSGEIEGLLATAVEAGLPCYLTGPRGGGKSSAVTAFAARHGRRLVRIQLTADTQPGDLVGQIGLVSGSTQFEPGPLTRAFVAGAWVLLDEVDMAPPGTLAALHAILERPATLTFDGATYQQTGRRRWFHVFATGNTHGHGDRSGLYAGTRQLNAAFMDRFMIVRVPELPLSAFEAVLTREGIPDSVVRFIIKTVKDTRQSARGDRMSEAVSMRQVEQFAAVYPILARRATSVREALAAAFTATISAKFAGADREALNHLLEFYQ